MEHMKKSFCSCGWNIILDVPYQENREQNNRYQMLFEGLAIIIILTALTHLSLYFNVVITVKITKTLEKSDNIGAVLFRNSFATCSLGST